MRESIRTTRQDTRHRSEHIQTDPHFDKLARSSNRRQECKHQMGLLQMIPFRNLNEGMLLEYDLIELTELRQLTKDQCVLFTLVPSADVYWAELVPRMTCKPNWAELAPSETAAAAASGNRLSLLAASRPGSSAPHRSVRSPRPSKSSGLRRPGPGSAVPEGATPMAINATGAQLASGRPGHRTARTARSHGIYPRRTTSAASPSTVVPATASPKSTPAVEEAGEPVLVVTEEPHSGDRMASGHEWTSKSESQLISVLIQLGFLKSPSKAPLNLNIGDTRFSDQETSAGNNAECGSESSEYSLER
ncbi:unnamed protein product [Protopolystoma xenopodis]|uniref:Uncharacterized protein n=1 Tax=Protopolystoma xenopodis TaxID=117903 RepID=A0A448XBT8_9PLAT|nr:unnamed protein product [Protopolystoma xenopodis]